MFKKRSNGKGVTPVGSTKLFESIQREDYQYAIRRAKKRPGEIDQWVETADDAVGAEKNGILPIHAACNTNDPSLELLRILIQKYPDSLVLKDQYGRTPLHIAVAQPCSLQIIVELISDHAIGKDATKEPDANGDLPLHVALNHNLKSTSSIGETSLFEALFPVVQELVKAYPQSVYEANLDGKTPLKIARFKDMGIDAEAKSRQKELVGVLNNGARRTSTVPLNPVKKQIHTQSHDLDADGTTTGAMDKNVAADEFLMQVRKEEQERKVVFRQYADAKRNAEANGEKVPEYVPPTPKKAFEPKPILPTQNQIKLPQSNGFEVRNDQKIDIPYDEDKIAISPSPEISLHLPPSIDNQKYLPLSSTKAVAKSSVQEPLNMNRLYKFIQRQDWKGATRWVQSHPNEADELYVHEDGTKSFPLMEAVKRKPTFDFVKEVMKNSIRGILTSDSKGRSPLHCAVLNRVSPECVDALLANEYKGTSEKTDNMGNLALHYAYSSGFESAVYKLLSAYPEAANVRNKDGKRPKEMDPNFKGEVDETVPIKVPKKNRNQIMTFIAEANWDGVISLCMDGSYEAEQWLITANYDEGSQILTRNLPIHIALTNPNIPVKAVDALVAANPNSLFSKNHRGRIPLHIACKHGVSLEVIEHLAKKRVQTLEIRDMNDEYPTNLASKYGHNDASSLLRDIYDSEHARDQGDEYWATRKEMFRNPKTRVRVKKGSSTKKEKKSSKSQGKKKQKFFETITSQNWQKALSMLKANPNCGKEMVVTKLGPINWKRTPLHEIVRLDPPIFLVRELIRAYPEALAVKESLDKRLPLHVACESSRLDIIELLMSKYPDSVSTPDAEGSIPIHLASLAGCKTEIFYSLLSADPETINTPNQHGQTPTDLSKVLEYSNRKNVVDLLNSAKDNYERKYHDLPVAKEAVMVSMRSSLRHLVSESRRSLVVSDGFNGGIVPDSNPVSAPIKYDVEICEGTTKLSHLLLSREWASALTYIIGAESSFVNDARIWLTIRHGQPAKDWRILPVHLSLLLQAPLAIVKGLLNVIEGDTPATSPESLSLVHLITKYTSEPAYLEAVKLNEEGVRELTFNLQNALHTACDAQPWSPKRNDASVEPNLEVIETILNIDRTLAQNTDFEGNLPLHILIRNCRNSLLPNTNIIAALLRAYPPAAQATNNHDETALQIFYEKEYEYNENSKEADMKKREIATMLLQDERYWTIGSSANLHVINEEEDSLNNKAAVVIQKVWRGYHVYLDFWFVYRGILRLQAQVRCNIQRQLFVQERYLRVAKEEEEARRLLIAQENMTLLAYEEKEDNAAQEKEGDNLVNEEKVNLLLLAKKEGFGHEDNIQQEENPSLSQEEHETRLVQETLTQLAEEEERDRLVEEKEIRLTEEEERIPVKEKGTRLAEEEEGARLVQEKHTQLTEEEDKALLVVEEDEREHLVKEREARLAEEEERARRLQERQARLAEEEERACLIADEEERARRFQEKQAWLAEEDKRVRLIAEKEESARRFQEKQAQLAEEEESARLAHEKEAQLSEEEKIARLAREKQALLAEEEESTRLAHEIEAQFSEEEESARLHQEKQDRIRLVSREKDVQLSEDEESARLARMARFEEEKEKVSLIKEDQARLAEVARRQEARLKLEEETRMENTKAESEQVQLASKKPLTSSAVNELKQKIPPVKSFEEEEQIRFEEHTRPDQEKVHVEKERARLVAIARRQEARLKSEENRLRIEEERKMRNNKMEAEQAQLVSKRLAAISAAKKLEDEGTPRKSFGVNQKGIIGARLLRHISNSDKGRDDDEEDEEIVGIFAFKEKERATVLYSQLNSLVEGGKWNRASKRVQGYKGEATLWIVGPDEKGLVWKRLPLHACCKKQPPKEFIQELLGAWRESCSHKDNQRSLPLHYACAFGASIDVIELLLRSSPNSIMVRNRDGLTPIEIFRLACQEQEVASKDEILSLLERDPTSWEN